jgi:hypothetical protein
VVTAFTTEDVSVKVAVVAPAETVTLAGTVATGVLLLTSVTITPPVGAGPLNVAVPVEDTPPTRLAGLKKIDESAGGFTVRVAVCVAL